MKNHITMFRENFCIFCKELFFYVLWFLISELSRYREENVCENYFDFLYIVNLFLGIIPHFLLYIFSYIVFCNFLRKVYPYSFHFVNFHSLVLINFHKSTFVIVALKTQFILRNVLFLLKFKIKYFYLIDTFPFFYNLRQEEKHFWIYLLESSVRRKQMFMLNIRLNPNCCIGNVIVGFLFAVIHNL